MNKIFFFLSFIFISSCSYIMNDWSEDGYIISSWHGAGNTKDLLLDIGGAFHGRVNDVHKIGSDETYIIVLDNLENYWILDKKRDADYLNADEIMLGPYNKNEFELKKQKLEIVEIDLTDEF